MQENLKVIPFNFNKQKFVSDLVDGGAWAKGVLTGEQGGWNDDADQNEVPHDGVALQPVAEYAQAVVLKKNSVKKDPSSPWWGGPAASGRICASCCSEIEFC